MVKSMKNPPNVIKLVMAAVCVMLEIKPDKVKSNSVKTVIFSFFLLLLPSLLLLVSFPYFFLFFSFHISFIYIMSVAVDNSVFNSLDSERHHALPPVHLQKFTASLSVLPTCSCFVIALLYIDI